ncbi:MAG TPA: TrpB-like pyridoxal phosphate-dependent enzyme [Syntrophorhabdaceae bacterium]|jgi:tryptophan synthase beta chain|nr:TrpB-like pyridoxal phosphate-dependent enzyme [Syntrophorhabdaceae bacterium]HPH42675.1 TrpB-like pyridoxal phosphate-dependent enzyme [Syntrophorhabdaceae bacterium]HPN98129.1 TrpB-like pyridoxal phosphate-dependent enzyme [Syntrophorhabdaceae bacterium]
MEKKILLNERDIPRAWYNIQADLQTPLPPPLNPETGEPITPDMLSQIFPMNIIEQEASVKRWIDIPDEIIEKLLIWRPTPLCRAYGLERHLGTPAKIYYKNEGVSPPGSHKPNTAVAQVYYNKISGTKRLTTETGAGQWGSALSFACNLFGLELKVYMVRVSYNQKPYRKIMMETWGGKCVPSPSPDTNTGKGFYEKNPEHPGSLGIAISEAIEDAVTSKDTKYSLGSVLNHVMLHQTVIGLEAEKQLASVNEYPDVVIGCAGGGSNFAGLSFPFIRDKIYGKNIKIIASEPTSCPTLTKGPYIYDFADTAKMTPLLPMHSIGHGFVPAPIHAGGLRYHGMSPIVSKLLIDGLIEARAYTQLETFSAGILFARTEGFIPAPETTHAIACVIEEAKRAKEEGKEKTILMNWSGHGIIDLPSYDAFLSGMLGDYVLPDEEIARLVKDLEKYPKPR